MLIFLSLVALQFMPKLKLIICCMCELVLIQFKRVIGNF